MEREIESRGKRQTEGHWEGLSLNWHVLNVKLLFVVEFSGVTKANVYATRKRLTLQVRHTAQCEAIDTSIRTQCTVIGFYEERAKQWLEVGVK